MSIRFFELLICSTCYSYIYRLRASAPPWHLAWSSALPLPSAGCCEVLSDPSSCYTAVTPWSSRTIVASPLPFLARVMTVFVFASFAFGFCGACFAPFGPCMVHKDGHVTVLSFARIQKCGFCGGDPEFEFGCGPLRLCLSSSCPSFVVSVLRFVFASPSSSWRRREDDRAGPSYMGVGPG